MPNAFFPRYATLFRAIGAIVAERGMRALHTNPNNWVLYYSSFLDGIRSSRKAHRSGAGL
jgi:transposase-like protein